MRINKMVPMSFLGKKAPLPQELGCGTMRHHQTNNDNPGEFGQKAILKVYGKTWDTTMGIMVREW